MGSNLNLVTIFTCALAPEEWVREWVIIKVVIFVDRCFLITLDQWDFFFTNIMIRMFFFL